jgi:selenocysteine lyase/cysteine desulfurase
MGVLYGKYDLLDRLTAYRVRPAPSDPPGKFETGTGNFEGMGGVLGALEYIEWVGETFGAEHAERYASDYSGRQLSFKLGMSAIRSYEFELSRALLDILAETPGVTIYGIQDTKRLEQRVPTCAFTLRGKSPRQVAEQLDEANIYLWDGNYYALEVTKRLGLEDSGGMVRVDPVQYNQAPLFWVRSPRTLGNAGGDQEVWGGFRATEANCGLQWHTKRRLKPSEAWSPACRVGRPTTYMRRSRH